MDHTMAISRRRFLGTAAATMAAPLAGASENGKIPTRVLGRTGAQVSILAFGCGTRFLQYKAEEEAVKILNRAIDLGINYFDTAYGYGKGVSEKRIGMVLKARRKEVFLADKLESRKADEAMREAEVSLKRLHTDHFDLLHIHNLTDEKDLAAIEAPDGVLKALYKLRDQKVARAIGITAHMLPEVLKTALDRHDFDCTQMALNAALAGMGTRQGGFGANRMAEPLSFQSLALPVANRKNMGVIAMKVFAQDYLSGEAPAEQLLRDSMSLPVAAAVVGMPKLEHLENNVALAKAFRPLAAAEMKQISERLSVEHKSRLDRIFCHHVDA